LGLGIQLGDTRRPIREASEFDPQDAADTLISKIAELCDTLISYSNSPFLPFNTIATMKSMTEMFWQARLLRMAHYRSLAQSTSMRCTT
jgi:hypothetical protein